jgi:uncharacterized protein
VRSRRRGDGEALVLPVEKLGRRGLAVLAERVTTVRRELGNVPDLTSLKTTLLAGLAQGLDLDPASGAVAPVETELADQLLREEIGTASFVEGPDLPVALDVLSGTQRAAGGLIEAHVRLRPGAERRIQQVVFTGDFFCAAARRGRSGGGACGLAGRRCRHYRRAVFRGTASCYPGWTGGLRRSPRGGPRTELRHQTMAKRLFIVLVNTDPRNPEELGAPFYHAAAAASMDYEVDVVCTATAGKLMRKGVAEALFVKPGAEMSVHDWIRQAHELGARFWACPANLELFDMKESDLIAECSGLMGAATMLHQLMEDDCRVLTY